MNVLQIGADLGRSYGADHCRIGADYSRITPAGPAHVRIVSNTYVYLCVYIYIYMYVYIHIYIYTIIFL